MNKKQKIPMFAGTAAHRAPTESPKKTAKETNPNVSACEGKLEKNSKGKKHKDGNEKRLQAQREMSLLRKTNNAVVQHALRNIDTGTLGPNKKIIFNDESEEEAATGEEKVKIETVGRKVSSLDVSGAGDAQQQLFEDDNSDEEFADEPSFHIRDEFQGKDGQKLFALQSRFNNDARFKVDKRFLEDDDDISSTERPSKKKLKKYLKAMSDKDESETTETSVKQTESEEASNQETSHAPEKFYYAVSENLNDLFSNQMEKQKFSFFNKAEEREDLEKGPNVVSSSEKPTLDQRTRSRPSRETEHTNSNFNPFKASGWFFIKSDDKRLQNGSKLFSRQDSDDTIRQKWLEARPTILEIFRKRRVKGRPARKKIS